MTLGGAAQLAAAHGPNERLDFGPGSLQLDRPTNVPASRTMTFTTQCSQATSPVRLQIMATKQTANLR